MDRYHGWNSGRGGSCLANVGSASALGAVGCGLSGGPVTAAELGGFEKSLLCTRELRSIRL